MTTPPEHIYAFIAAGEDSFMAMQIEGVWYPMVTIGRRPETIVSMRAVAAEVAKTSGKTISLIEFTRSKVIDVIEP